jgi:hypothetical protein
VRQDQGDFFADLGFEQGLLQLAHTLLEHADLLGRRGSDTVGPASRPRLDRGEGGLQRRFAQLMEARLANAEPRVNILSACQAKQGAEDALQTFLGLGRALQLVDEFQSVGPTSTHDRVPP